jgi:hypothetical protein
MAERRGRGEGGVHFEHSPGTNHRPGSGKGNDPDNTKQHRGCTGPWRGEVVLSNSAGERVVRKRVSASTKTELYEKLKDLKDELGQGVRSSATYTVQMAADDWLATLTDKADETVATQGYVLKPLLEKIGKIKLRELDADDVLRGLKSIAATRTTRTLRGI